MKFTILLDNNTLIDRYFCGEPGLSFFIEEDNKNFLFDTGYSNAFIQNAIKMNINLLNIDYIVLSHSHLDHTWGLASLIKLYTEAKIEDRAHKKAKIITHPDLFNARTIAKIGDIGSIISKELLAKKFELNLSKKPFWLTDNLVFLGQIPRKFDFEGNTSILDDSSLVYKSSKGLVIITGCAHAGICNTIEYAKEICKHDKVADVIGGFHLQKPNTKLLQGTLAYFKKIKPTIIHPCHCTDFQSKCALSSVVNIEEVGVGTTKTYGGLYVK